MADKPESKKPELSFYGLKADEVSPAMRPVFDAYAMAEQALVDQKRVQQKADLPGKDQLDLTDPRLTNIRAQLPSDQKREEMQKALHNRRGIFEGGFGQTALDDQQKRLGRILKRRSKEDSQEARQKLLEDLIKTTREKGGAGPEHWDAFNPAYHPSQKGVLDTDAMEVLNVWSMQNLSTKFKSPTDLWHNFGRTAQTQEDLSKDAEELIMEKLKTEKPKDVRFAIINGKKVAAVPKFGEGIDESIGESTQNNLLRLLYKDNTEHDLLDHYAQGMAVNQDRDAVVEALGSERDADRLLSNAFFATESALPSETYIPVSATPDGRYAIDRSLMKLSIENLLFNKERRKRGLLPNEVPEEDAKKMRESARNRATKMTAVLDQSDNLVVHVDPVGARRDYLEGRGWRAGLHTLTSWLNTAVTLGLDESVMKDIPDNIARGLIALTLPRKTAGIVTRTGEQEAYIKEGEFFGPAIGDSAIPNALDFILRLTPDEALATSFSLAVDDEAKQRNEPGVGRRARIIKNMINNFGSDRHIEKTTEDAFASARLLMEAGDVFINPSLGEFGENNPLPGQIAGGVGVFALMLLSPGPLEGVAAGVAGGRAGLKVVDPSGVRVSTQLLNESAKRVDDALRAADETVVPIDQVKTQEQAVEYLGAVSRAMDTDTTGGMQTIDVLASFATLEKSGLIAGRGKPLELTMKLFDQLRTKSVDLAKQADADLAKARKATSPSKKLQYFLDAGLKKLAEHENFLEAESVVFGSIQDLVRSQAIAENIVGISRVEKSALKIFIGAFTDGDITKALKGLDLLNPDAAKLVRKQLTKDRAKGRRLLTAQIAKEMEGLLGKGRAAKRGKMTEETFEQIRVAMGDAKGKYLQASSRLENYYKTIGKDLDKFSRRFQAALAGVYGVKIDDLSDASKLDGSKLSRRLRKGLKEFSEVQARTMGKYNEVHRQLAAATKQTEDVAKMAPKALAKAQVDVVKAYVGELALLSKSIQQVAEINPRVFEQAQELIRGRDRASFKQEMGIGEVLNPATLEQSPLIGVATREGAEMAGKLNLDNLEGPALVEKLKNATDELFLTDTLIKIFTDPYGVAQFARNKFLQENGVLSFWAVPRTWAVFTALEMKRVYRQYPIFTTNLRMLESPVSRELDDLHKEQARMAQNWRDNFNIVADNVPAEDLSSILFSLVTTPGKIVEIESRYRLPFTPAQRITLDTAAGMAESPVRLFFKRAVSMGRARHLKTDVKMGDMPGLDGMISNLVDEATLQNRTQFVTKILPEEIKPAVLQTFLRMHTDGSAAKLSDGELLHEMIRNIQMHIASKKAARESEVVKFADDAGRPIIGTRSAGQIYQNIIVGAMLEQQFARMNSITGSRFTIQQAEGLNRLYGTEAARGGEKGPVAKDIIVGSYVVLSEDIAAAKRLASSVFNKRGDATGKGLGVSTTVRTGKVEPKKGETKKQKPGWRSPILEKLSGAPAFRVNRIELPPEGSRGVATKYHLNATDDAGNPLVLTRQEIEMRPYEFTLLDLVDGASILGLESLTQAGRQAVSHELAGARIQYQELVLTGVDEFGNVRVAPRPMINNLITSFERMERELGEAISPDVAAHGLLRQAPDILAGAIRIWKTHILTGLAVPRPAYFMNEVVGNFAQMVDEVGFIQAGQLSMLGSMAYVPFYGRALQEAYFRLAAKHGGEGRLLPFAFSAMYSSTVNKVLSGSDELMGRLPDGTNPTYGQMLAQAMRAGGGETIINPDMSRVLRDVLVSQQKANPTLYQKLSKNGQNLAYMQRMMQLKIREVTRRQRILFYLHQRVNRGMNHDAASLSLKNTLYDWSFSVGKLEMQHIGRFVLFYTLVKNAMAQVSRTFLEFSNVGAREYAKRYARGGTKLQRMELMSRLMTAETFDRPSPFVELSAEEQRERAARRALPGYLSEYPILTINSLPPAALEIMGEGGFVRTNYARVLPKLTTVEFMMNYLDIIGSLSAVVASLGGGLDPEGKIFPYSTNTTKSSLALTETFLDQFLVPVYADITENMVREFMGVRRGARSEHGARVGPGDMAMMQLLGKVGLADASTIITDPRDPRAKRIVGFYSSPFVEAAVNMPKTEIHRLRMMMSLMFPGMAPAEIRALAETDKSAGIRLEALANLMNTGKAVFYNGNNERYYELKMVRNAYNRLERRIENQLETPIGED